jgi:hypothetical protein
MGLFAWFGAFLGVLFLVGATLSTLYPVYYDRRYKPIEIWRPPANLKREDLEWTLANMLLAKAE